MSFCGCDVGALNKTDHQAGRNRIQPRALYLRLRLRASLIKNLAGGGVGSVRRTLETAAAAMAVHGYRTYPCRQIRGAELISAIS